MRMRCDVCLHCCSIQQRNSSGQALEPQPVFHLGVFGVGQRVDEFLSAMHTFHLIALLVLTVLVESLLGIEISIAWHTDKHTAKTSNAPAVHTAQVYIVAFDINRIYICGIHSLAEHAR